MYDLIGIDGNAYCVMMYVMWVMSKCGFNQNDQNEYYKEATSSDYNHLLAVSQDMIDKCNSISE